MSTIIYIYQWGFNGKTFDNPQKETKQEFMVRNNLSTDAEIIALFKTPPIVDWFMGIQADYDKLYSIVKYYYKINGIAGTIGYQILQYLKDGTVQNTPTFDDLTPDGAIELTKAEYDVLLAKNQVVQALLNKVNDLKTNSSTKLAAYIIKCEEYLSQHIGDIKADSLTSIIGTNGKIDVVKLEAQIKANTEKKDSMADLCEVYLAWILAIEKGTQADLDMLPDEDPTKLNATIDSLWKAEHDKERKALIAVLHATEAEFAIVDKYTSVVQGDEPE